MLKKLIKGIRSGRKARLIIVGVVILTTLPLVINTLLNVTSQSVKADSFFKFDEGYGTTSAVNDANGTVSAGSITNAVWKTEDLCKTGKCLYFDGTGDYVSFADNVNLDMAASDEVTVNLWFRTGDITSGTRTLISKYETTGGDGGYQIYMNSDGKLVFGIDSDNSGFPLYSVTSANAYDDNRWHFLSAVKNGTTSLILYIDALHQGTTGISSTNTLNDDSFYIGIDNALANGFTGFIDEVRVTRSATSESEVKTDYLGGTTKAKDPGLIGYWDFNENTGTVAYDKSGNVNNGSISNAGWTTGNFGSAVSMSANSVTENVTVSDPISGILDITAGMNVTFQAWVKTSSVSESPQIIRKIESFSGTLPGYGLTTSYGEGANGINCLVVDDASDQVSYPTGGTGNDIADGNWHHIACVFDRSSGLYLYYDGVLVGSDTTLAVTDSLANSENLFIGEESTIEEFGNGGSIDDAKIYNYARTQEQIQEDMNQYSPPGVSASFGPDNSWLSNGLVGYWKMDDNVNAEGQTITDASGNGNSGTLFGDNSTGDNGSGMDCDTGGKYGYACTFDGTDDYISVSDNDIHSFGNGTTDAPFSVSVWTYISTIQTSYLINKSSEYYLYIASNGYLRFFVNDDSASARIGRQYATSFPLNSWHLLTATYDGSGLSTGIRIYLDGQQVDNADYNNGSYTAMENLGQGLRFSENGITPDGQIDEVRVYNRALSPAEVADLYNWAPGPVGYWKFDENTGAVAYDQSGNGNSANLTNSGWITGQFGSGIETAIDTAQDVATVTDPASGILDFSDTQSFTYGGWVKLSSAETTAVRPIYKGAINTSTAGYMLGLGGNPITSPSCYYTSGNGTGFDQITASGAISEDGQWHYYTCVMDRTGVVTGTPGLFIFVDGVLKGSDTALTEGSAAAGSQNLLIGERDTSIEFDGGVDDVKIYNYARTPAQIIQDMNAGHPAPGSPVGSAVGEWSFDEGYGNTIRNSGTYGSAADGTFGTAPATPTWTNNGKYAKAVTFDGANDNIDITDSLWNTLANEDITISAWINMSGDLNANYGVIFGDCWGAGYTNTSPCLAMKKISSGNYALVYVTDTTDQGTTLSYTPGTWYHVMVVRNGTANTITFYRNAVNAGTISPTITDSIPSQVGIGQVIGYGYNFKGSIDELKVYRLAMTPDQVKTEYNQGMSAVFGAISTDESGNASFADLHGYCPPGQTTACVGPVAHWKMDENTGTTVNDISGNSNNSTTWTGDTKWTTGKLGSALSFDGDNDVVRFTETTSTDLGTLTDSYTVEGWFKTSADFSTSAIIACKNDNSGPWPFCLYLNSANAVSFYVSASGAGLVTSLTFYNDNRWHHAAGVRDVATDKVYLYIDGVLAGESADNTTASAKNDDEITIGNGGTSYNIWDFNGDIDDVKIYNYARTPAQIAWDYNRGGPVAWYRFDECSGTNANDTSGNNLDGTIVPGTGTPPQNTAAGSCSSGNNYEMWNDGTTGKYGASLGFDGYDDYMSVSNEIVNNYPFVVSAWVKTTTSTEDVIASLAYSSSNVIYYGLEITSAGKGAAFADAGLGGGYQTATGTTNVNDGNWHHLVGVFTSSSDRKIYVDGKQEGADTDNVTFQSTVDRWNIGRQADSTPSEYFDGQIDEVKIWNYALTQEQINNEYNQGSAVRF